MPKITDTPESRKRPKTSHAEPPTEEEERVLIEALERLERQEGRQPLALVRDSDEHWESGLRFNKNGMTRDPGNAALILANDPAWASLAYDEFTGREVCPSVPPLTGLAAPTTPEGLEIYITHWLAMRYRQSFSQETVRGAIHYASRRRSFHQVRDYLETLEWDGVERIGSWLSTYLGAENTEANAAIGRMWLISGVARAYVPGAKADHMLVLEGDQGTRKTTALEALCSPPWFQPDLGDLRNKDSQLTLKGKWVVCMDELHSLKSSDVTEIAKNYLTRTVDKYRPPYGRHEIEQPRSCIFAGTTNADTYLTDPTGNRRFWPVGVALCKPIDLEAIKADRDQLWAEAKAAYQSGEQWWPNKELQRCLTELTELRTEGDEWEGKVASYVLGYLESYVTIGGILTSLGIEPADWSRREQTRVGLILKRLKWSKQQSWNGGKRERRFYPPTPLLS